MELVHRLEQTPQPTPFLPSQSMSQHSFGQESGLGMSPQVDSFTPGPVSDPAVLQCRMDLMSHWADEPDQDPTRVPRKPRPSRNGFEQVASGEHGHSIAEKNAPSQIVIPKEMTQGMRVAWNQSLPIGSPQEHGGVLVRNKDGSLSWLPSEPGDSREIELNYHDVSPHQTLLAGGHTHPYGKNEHNFTDVPFSGRDLAEHVFAARRLSIVQSGEGMYGSARTKEFDEMVNARDEAGKQALSDEIEHFWRSYFEDAEGNTPEKAAAATRATSEWYHLLYYSGKQGTLQRVSTSPKPDAGRK